MERRNRQIKEFLREREIKKRISRERDEDIRRIRDMEEKYKREVNRYTRGSGTWRRSTRERSTGTGEGQGHGGEVQERGQQVQERIRDMEEKYKRAVFRCLLFHQRCAGDNCFSSRQATMRQSVWASPTSIVTNRDNFRPKIRDIVFSDNATT